MLSILIPTVTERKESFAKLMTEITLQISQGNHWQDVEVIFDNTQRGKATTGEKRNFLLLRANKKYTWFVDDDDMILPGAIPAILQAAQTDCDTMAVNGFMTTDGGNRKDWYIALGNPYSAQWNEGKEIYLRYPNHITPMKREIAATIEFPAQNNFEDKVWADKLKDSALLKTETKIEIPIYHYQYSSTNKLY